MNLNEIKIYGLLKDNDLLMRLFIIILALFISKNILKERLQEDKRLRQMAKEQSKIIEVFDQITRQEKELKSYQASFGANSDDISAILTNIADSAKDARVNIVSLTPEAQRDTAFYYVLPIKINLLGDYHTISTFLAKLESYKGLLKVANLNFDASGKEELRADVSLNVFYLKE